MSIEIRNRSVWFFDIMKINECEKSIRFNVQPNERSMFNFNCDLLNLNSLQIYYLFCQNVVFADKLWKRNPNY
jgi:hypothetical protein